MAPIIPYPVDVTVYQIDSVTPSSGATVKIINTATGERLSGTTNALGQVILDLANLTSSVGNVKSGYSNRDVFAVDVTDGTYKARTRRTVNVAVGADSLTMYLLNSTETLGLLAWNAYQNHFEVKNMTVWQNSDTILVPPTQAERYTAYSVEFTNRSAKSLTINIWVSNATSPGDLGSDMWATMNVEQISIGATTQKAYQFNGRYKWVCVVGRASANTNNDVDVRFLAIND